MATHKGPTWDPLLIPTTIFAAGMQLPWCHELSQNIESAAQTSLSDCFRYACTPPGNHPDAHLKSCGRSASNPSHIVLRLQRHFAVEDFSVDTSELGSSRSWQDFAPAATARYQSSEMPRQCSEPAGQARASARVTRVSLQTWSYICGG